MIYDTKVGMADQSSSAFFSLTQAEYAAGTRQICPQRWLVSVPAAVEVVVAPILMRILCFA